MERRGSPHVRGRVDVVAAYDLRPFRSLWDMTGDLLANLQSSADSHDIVQIGWMKCGKIAGLTCGHDVPADSTLHFMYVCDDGSGGEPCDAGSWAGSPVIGHRYRFRIQYNQTGTHQWDYSIKDYTTGVTKSTKIASTWHNPDGAWWGGENRDTGSIMGSAHIGSNDIEAYWLQYFRTIRGFLDRGHRYLGDILSSGLHRSWAEPAVVRLYHLQPELHSGRGQHLEF